MNRTDNPAVATSDAGCAAIEDAQSTPDHLVQIPGEHWALWKWFCLRGAGFSAAWATQLAAPAAAAAADELMAAEDAVRESQRDAIEAVRRALDETADLEHRKRLLQALKHLKNGRVPAP